MIEDIRGQVRGKYGAIARNKTSCCGPAGGCCGSGGQVTGISETIGYSENELQSVPDDANLGLGCGNPTAMASLKDGEVVVDLGSGGGLDCFIAAEKVGKTGGVIGVDMTHDMIDLARGNAEKANVSNVEFRLGEIENLPVADNFADVIISNCVVNLSPDKDRVFKEAYRVLKPGGRMMISDIVLLRPLPDGIRESVDAYVGCIAGAMLKEDYLNAIARAGFDSVDVVHEQNFGIIADPSEPFSKSLIEQFNMTSDQLAEVSESVVSLNVEGRKSA